MPIFELYLYSGATYPSLKRSNGDVLMLESGLKELEQYIQDLAPYTFHLGNCNLSSWNLKKHKCDCGLFELLNKIGYDINKV